jgi:hypothetical protein
MLRVMGYLFKLTLFSILILVLGNVLRWDGKTISDQVRLQMSHAERSGLFGTVRNWADRVTYDTRKGFQQKTGHSLSESSESEDISPSERQKLKALIRELNRSHRED